MIIGIALDRQPGQHIAAVIIDVFDRRTKIEAHSLAGAHLAEVEGEGDTKGVLEEAFEGMRVEGTIGVGNVEAVVVGVDVLWLGRGG